MLNKDAADVEERINNVILGIRGNYVCHDTDIIKGLEIVKGVNETVNAEIMDEEHVNLINAGIKVYTDKYNSNFVSVPRYINQGIMHGEMIVSAVSMKHVKQKLKSKDNK